MSNKRIKKQSPLKTSSKFSFASIRQKFGIPMFGQQKSKKKGKAMHQRAEERFENDIRRDIDNLLIGPGETINEEPTTSATLDESRFATTQEYETAAVNASSFINVDWSKIRAASRTAESDEEDSVVLVPQPCRTIHDIDEERKMLLEKQKNAKNAPVQYEEGELLSSDDDIQYIGEVNINQQPTPPLKKNQKSNKPITPQNNESKEKTQPENTKKCKEKSITPNRRQKKKMNKARKSQTPNPISVPLNIVLPQNQTLPDDDFPIPYFPLVKPQQPSDPITAAPTNPAMIKSNFQFVSSPPNQSLRNARPFREVSCSNTNPIWRNRGGGFNLKICTFNVLCEDTKLKCMYLYKQEQQQIPWEQRWNLLIDEIVALNADVFCLQEVQRDHYAKFFEPLLHQFGFKCYYTAKDGILSTDGCMLAYRKDLFTDLRFEHVYYNYGVEGFDKHNVGQVILLQENKTGLMFIVANTHILFNMKRGDIKTGQVALLLAAVDKFTSVLQANDRFCGTFLLGDFNIEPQSPIYQFIRSGYLPYSKYLFKSLALSSDYFSNTSHEKFCLPGEVPVDLMNCKFIEVNSNRMSVMADSIYHSQRFLSAYRHFTEENSKEVSTFHTDSACPDFIFYSGHQSDANAPVEETRIIIKKILMLPSLKTLELTCGPMPNNQCGSDHLPLMAEFYVC